MASTSLSDRPLLSQLFDYQAARTPDALALIDGATTLTYAALHARANQLAHALRQRGVRDENLVGVCLEPSCDLVVALLGILKAGGAYVPLDPTYPRERLSFMLADTGAPCVVTHTAARASVPETPAQVLNLDADRAHLMRCPTTELPVRAAEDALAYVIYTSGSTGQPKGVMGTHQGTINRLQWEWRTAPYTPGEVGCAKTSISFVDHVAELFAPLLAGVSVVLLSQTVVQDPPRLLDALAAHRVTRLTLVPALLQVLLATDTDFAAKLPQLRRWVSSGEELPRGLAQAFHTRMPHARLLNVYGSSEVAADATWYDTREELAGDRVPIGRPLPGVSLAVLDEQRQPVPRGKAGELYIGGVCLARGYWQQPALTAERFVVDPETGARLYKTADLVRQRPDGVLDYLGRVDHQIKLRGVRIEPGEIEAVLMQHPAVREAVVVARQVQGEPHLLAYMVGTPGSVPAPTSLRLHLVKWLPLTLVPSRLVWLDTLPRTPNGKIDRAALPDVATGPSASLGTVAPPRTALERRLTQLWEQLLGVAPIGRDDNFFALGGTSLHAAQLVAQLGRWHTAQPSLSSVFHAPTIAAFARLLDAGERPPWHFLVPVKPQGHHPPWWCVHGPGGLARVLPADQPYWGLEPHGLQGDCVPATVEAMAADYAQEIRQVQPQDPYVLGGYSQGAVIAWELARQLQQAGAAVALLVLLDPPGPGTALKSAAASGWDLQTRWVRQRERARWAACTTCLRLGRRVPAGLRTWYHLEAGDRAVQGYVPQVLTVCVLLLTAQQHMDPAATLWQQLTTGPVEHQTFPGTHEAIMTDAAVQALVARHVIRALATQRDEGRGKGEGFALHTSPFS